MMDAADVDKDGRIDYAGQSVSHFTCAPLPLTLLPAVPQSVTCDVADETPSFHNPHLFVQSLRERITGRRFQHRLR